MTMKLEKNVLETMITKGLRSETAKNTLRDILKNNEIARATCPNTFSEDVALKNKGETAYQRAIIAGKTPTSKMGDAGEVKWLDIELPVVFGGNARRRCLDIIGSIKPKFVLCELKYSNKSKSNNPVYALLELLIYYYHIQNNASALAKETIRHKGNARGAAWDWNDCANPKNVILAVAANKKYWDGWGNRNWHSHIAMPIAEIKKQLEFLDIKFYSTASISENSKKKENNRYEVAPLNPDWTEITELK
jgi:hypothetical protein